MRGELGTLLGRQPLAGLDHVDEHQADDDRRGGENEREEKRPRADATKASKITQFEYAQREAPKSRAARRP